MSDEKPKHKPQHRHTLSEVLKSLQDLIRADLVSGKTPPPNPADHHPPVAAEADSFNDAIERLDRMITERIIEPTERAREEPPEPLLPDETLEIEWEGEPEGPADANIEATQTLEASPPGELADIEETIELAPPPEPEPTSDLPAIASTQPPSAPPAGSAELGESLAVPEAPLDFAADAPTLTSAPDPQHTFDFALFEPGEPPAPREQVTETAPGPPEAATSDVLILDTSDTSPAEGEPALAPESSTDTFEPSPLSLSEQREPHADEPASPQAISEHVVEYTGSSTKANALADAPAGGDNPGTVDATSKADIDAVNARSKSDESRKEPRVTDETKTSVDPDSVPRGDEIPVLQDIADVRAPPAAPLPDAAQARDIAIRVIARLNIERRKSGEKPLDIKTIERLQQYLADALTKRALNKPK